MKDLHLEFDFHLMSDCSETTLSYISTQIYVICGI